MVCFPFFKNRVQFTGYCAFYIFRKGVNASAAYDNFRKVKKKVSLQMTRDISH